MTGIAEFEPDFTSAEVYLKRAQKAHEEGDKLIFEAACKLLAVALGMKYDKR